MEKQHFTAINQVMNPWFRTFVAAKKFVQQQISTATLREAFNGLGSLFSDEKPEPKFEQWSVQEWLKDEIMDDLELFMIDLKYPRTVLFAHALQFDTHNVRMGYYAHPMLDEDLSYGSSTVYKQMARLILGYAIDECEWPRNIFQRDISAWAYFDKTDISK